MSEYIGIRKEDADRLSKAIGTGLLPYAGGVLGDIVRAVYVMAHHSFDIPDDAA